MIAGGEVMVEETRLVFRIGVNGQPVEGKISYLSFSDIEVEITHPFSDVATRSHLPYFALPYRRFARGGAITSYGVQVARRLLREVYDACVFCEARQDELVLACRLFFGEYAGSLLGNVVPTSVPWFVLFWLLTAGSVTDCLAVERCRAALFEQFRKWLPEDLVRRPLARAMSVSYPSRKQGA